MLGLTQTALQSNPLPPRIRKVASRLMRVSIQAAGDFYSGRYMFLAAAVSFYTVLAVVPLLIVIASVASFMPFQSIDWTRLIHAAIPSLLLDNDTVVGFLTMNRGAYGISGFAIAYILSQGLFRALDQALFVIFDKKPRKFREYIRLQLIIFPFFILGMITAYMIATSLSEILNKLLLLPFFSEGIPYYLITLFHKTTSVFGMVTIFLFLLTLYHVLAPRVKNRFGNSLIVATFISVLFLLLRKGFGVYFSYISTAENIYGAFSGVFGILLWVLMGYALIFYGARVLYLLELNGIPLKQNRF